MHFNAQTMQSMKTILEDHFLHSIWTFDNILYQFNHHYFKIWRSLSNIYRNHSQSHSNRLRILSSHITNLFMKESKNQILLFPFLFYCFDSFLLLLLSARSGRKKKIIYLCAIICCFPHLIEHGFFFSHSFNVENWHL